LGTVIRAPVVPEDDRRYPRRSAAVGVLVAGGDQTLRIDIPAGVTGDHYVEGRWFAVVQGLEAVRVWRAGITLGGDVEDGVVRDPVPVAVKPHPASVTLTDRHRVTDDVGGHGDSLPGDVDTVGRYVGHGV
jgi:hypothetical protein